MTKSVRLSKEVSASILILASVLALASLAFSPLAISIRGEPSLRLSKTRTGKFSYDTFDGGLGLDVKISSLSPDLTYVTNDTHPDLIGGQGIEGFLPYELVDIPLTLTYKSDGAPVANTPIHVSIEKEKVYYEYDDATNSSGAFNVKIVIPYSEQSPMGVGTWTMTLSDSNRTVGMFSLIAAPYDYVYSVENDYRGARVHVLLVWKDDGEPVTNKGGKLQVVLDGETIGARINDEGWVEFDVPFTFDLKANLDFTFAHTGVHKRLMSKQFEVVKSTLADLGVYGDDAKVGVKGKIVLNGEPISGVFKLETRTKTSTTSVPSSTFHIVAGGNEEAMLRAKVPTDHVRIVNTIDCERVIYDPIGADVFVESYQGDGASLWTLVVVSKTKFITMRNVLVKVDGKAHALGDLRAGGSKRLTATTTSPNPLVEVYTNGNSIATERLSP